jgi:hypothetical protein
MKRKRKHLHSIQPLSFQKPSLFKNPFLWIGLIVAVSLTVGVFID